MSDANEFIGPVDYLILELASDRRDGSIAAALLELVESGVVTVLDLIVVEKDVDGVVSGVELDTLDGELRIFAGARSGLLGADDLVSAGSALQPGTTAAVLVYENAWARPFVAAARSAGADVVATARIPADVLNEVLDALDAAG